MRDGSVTAEDVAQLELPWSAEMVDAFRDDDMRQQPFARERLLDGLRRRRGFDDRQGPAPRRAPPLMPLGQQLIALSGR